QFPASSPKWDTLSECDCRTQDRACCTTHALFDEVTGWAVGFLIPFHHPGFSQLTVHPVTSFPLLMSFNLGLKAAT
ncbi:hypothetical protein GB704_24530, partial [Salmonella enterica]|nr:hypothetical protein [Salmonella enterica]